MMKLFPLILIVLSIKAYSQARPYKILIITDRDAMPKATEFRNYLRTKPPFNRMGEAIQLEIVSMSKDEMNCGNTMPDAPRVILCNERNLARKQAEHEANLAVAFTSAGSGGAGGSIPVASKDYPIQTMFHEMLHAYGLDDEYTYSPSEKSVYCRSPRTSGNMAYFQDVPPYANDHAARTRHAPEIPWYGGIPANKHITTGRNLGSPYERISPGNQTLGLYRGGSCDSAALPGWRPYQNSIMRGYDDDTIYPLYEEIIVKNIESSLGRRLHLPPPSPDCGVPNMNLNRLFDFEKDIRKVTGRIHPPHLHSH